MASDLGISDEDVTQYNQQDDLQNSIKDIYASLAHEIEFYIQKLQQDLLRIPGTVASPKLPWLGRGVKGIWRKLVHGDTPENPDWWYGQHGPSASPQQPAQKAWPLNQHNIPTGRLSLSEYYQIDETVSDDLDGMLTEAFGQMPNLPSVMQELLSQFRTNIASTIKKHFVRLYHLLRLSHIMGGQPAAPGAPASAKQTAEPVVPPVAAGTPTTKEPDPELVQQIARQATRQAAAAPESPPKAGPEDAGSPKTPPSSPIEAAKDAATQAATQAKRDGGSPEEQQQAAADAAAQVLKTAGGEPKTGSKALSGNWKQWLDSGANEFGSRQMRHSKDAILTVVPMLAKEGVDLQDQQDCMRKLDELYKQAHYPEGNAPGNPLVSHPGELADIDLFEHYLKTKYHASKALDYDTRKAVTEQLYGSFPAMLKNGKVFAGPWMHSKGLETGGTSGLKFFPLWAVQSDKGDVLSRSVSRAWEDIMLLMVKQGKDPFDKEHTNYFLQTAFSRPMPLDYGNVGGKNQKLSAAQAYVLHLRGKHARVGKEVLANPNSGELVGSIFNADPSKWPSQLGPIKSAVGSEPLISKLRAAGYHGMDNLLDWNRKSIWPDKDSVETAMAIMQRMAHEDPEAAKKWYKAVHVPHAIKELLKRHGRTDVADQFEVPQLPADEADPNAQYPAMPKHYTTAGLARAKAEAKRHNPFLADIVKKPFVDYTAEREKMGSIPAISDEPPEIGSPRKYQKEKAPLERANPDPVAAAAADAAAEPSSIKPDETSPESKEAPPEQEKDTEGEEGKTGEEPNTLIPPSNPAIWKRMHLISPEEDAAKDTPDEKTPEEETPDETDDSREAPDEESGESDEDKSRSLAKRFPHLFGGGSPSDEGGEGEREPNEEKPDEKTPTGEDKSDEEESEEPDAGQSGVGDQSKDKPVDPTNAITDIMSKLRKKGGTNLNKPIL